MLRVPEPVQVVDLFVGDRTALLDLLASLGDDEWTLPTACTGWSVKDVAIHMLGVDVGNLSYRRDSFHGLAPTSGESTLAFVNRINDEWMQAARRLSTRVVRDLLAVVGAPLFDYFSSLDLAAFGGPVSWAGPEPAPVWLDVAREYTERWHHQQHIRDAVGKPGQLSRRYLHPVLATFVHALPLTLRDVAATVGTVAHLCIQGEAGGDWSVARDRDRWRLYDGATADAAATVTLDPASAWRLFTRGITPDQARRTAVIVGDSSLGERVLHAVAIIA